MTAFLSSLTPANAGAQITNTGGAICVLTGSVSTIESLIWAPAFAGVSGGLG